jgi:hypothetical protein
MHRSIAIVSMLAALGCGGTDASGGSGTPASTCPIPTVSAHPTFTVDILPAIQPSCGAAATSCHGGPTAFGHVDYSTSLSRTAADVRADLVGVPPANAPAGYDRVKAGDPAHSWIVMKVTSDQPGGSGYGSRMPLGRPNLCQATVDTLVAWISAGAPL